LDVVLLLEATCVLGLGVGESDKVRRDSLADELGKSLSSREMHS
jgi:hypothetical protein